MATFARVRLEAPKAAYPILLSNGNRVAAGDVGDDGARHFAEWEDPFPKVRGETNQPNTTQHTHTKTQHRKEGPVPSAGRGGRDATAGRTTSQPRVCLSPFVHRSSRTAPKSRDRSIAPSPWRALLFTKKKVVGWGSQYEGSRQEECLPFLDGVLEGRRV
jgi:hypothetical protein